MIDIVTTAEDYVCRIIEERKAAAQPPFAHFFTIHAARTMNNPNVPPSTPVLRTALPYDTIELAQSLLGRRIVRVTKKGTMEGRIVETEAYPPGDPAAHAYKRMTVRNRSLFLDVGHAYIYRAYGTSWMLNVSSESDGVGAGVLIRALAPEVGLAIMEANRARVAPRDLTRGPGRLAQALAIDRSLDATDLCAPGSLFIADDARETGEIGVSVRIGITRAIERPWRFFLRESRFVSGPAWLNRPPNTCATSVRPRRPLPEAGPTR